MQSDSAKKVLFIARSMRGGGAERFLTILLRHIDKSRFLPVLGLVEKKGAFLKDLPKDIEVIDLGAKRVLYSLPRLVALVRTKRPAAVFSTIGYLTLAIVLVRPFMPLGTKIIARETNIPSINLWQSPCPSLFLFLYRWLYPRVDRAICQSHDMMNDLLENFPFPLEKGVVINNPVDGEAIRKHAHKKKDVFSGKNVDILAVGKLMYQKGFDLLLKAMAQIGNRKLHLTILGEGPEETNLKWLANELNLGGQVALKGFVENPYPYMVQADLFVLSSRFEGFPNVVLEALVCGTPVVAFDCPGGIGEIIQDGLNGWKVERGNTTAFADTIERALATRWDRDLIKKSVEKKFGAEKIIAEYERVFVEVLGTEQEEERGAGGGV